MKLTRLVGEIELSSTLALDARAKSLVAQGRDVINMSVGELDFPAPAAARNAARARVASGDVRYTHAAGTSELRSALARHVSATRGAAFTAEEIVVCHSCKHALSGSVLALVGPGDEVLIPLPAWGSYFAIVRIAGGIPRPVPAAPGCRPDLAALAAAVTPRTRAVLFNSPCNPSGYVWTREEVAALGHLCCERDLALISDEVYRRLVFEGEPAVSPASLGAEIRARTVIVDGASKAFAMTGYRIGYVAAPPPVAAAVIRLHSQMTGAPNTISQAAYGAVLGEEPPEVAGFVKELRERRDFLLDRLDALGLSTPRPRGAFYVFPDVTRFLDERGSAGFCEDLLEQHNLAVVPGSVFGMDGHVRLSYALAADRIAEAASRLESFVLARRAR